MNVNGNIKLDFNPADAYQKAKKDLCTALDSLNQLNKEQQVQLIYELLGAKAVNDFINFVQSYNK